MMQAFVVAHPCAQNAQGWGTRINGGYKPHRASLDWTAEGGCPHMVISANKYLSGRLMAGVRLC